MAIATFAGGCFWCMVEPFDQQEGIISVVSGYTGGDKENPTYEEVTEGATGHVEAIQITYDELLMSYEQLLSIFWQQIDPNDATGQFADRGTSYQTAIFYHTETQRKLAEASRTRLEKSQRFPGKIATPIIEAKVFYPAENYHQDYYRKNQWHYQMYKKASGRKQFIDAYWKTDKKRLKEVLTPMQYYVTQENGTESPFNNAYYQQHQEGIYVDIVSGEPLFSTKDQFDAGCGWPSFAKPLLPVKTKKDKSHRMDRIEVRSKLSDSHLGHLFDDGPKDMGGLRYCINSASLRFIPKGRLDVEGYGAYMSIFKGEKND